MKPALALLAVLFAVTGVVAPPNPAHAGFYYLDPRQLDLTILLPPPPDDGSTESQADERAVAETIAARSASQIAEAREASQRSVFFFAPSVGGDFTPQRLPLTAAFFARVSADVHRVVGSAKAYWERPRPDGGGRKHRSYPSGHAAFAASTAILLAQLLPSKRDAIFSQARIFAANRILLGLHYPTDIAAGWTAGTLAACVMMRDVTFQRDFARVKKELQSIYG